MKLVFLDMEQQCILLFSEGGMNRIPLSQMYVLKSMIKNEPVLYVSDAMVTNANEIVNLVSSLNQSDYENVGSHIEQPQAAMTKEDAYASGENIFARSTKQGLVFINDMGQKDPQGNRTGHSFKGPLDFQPVSYLDQIGFNESQQIHSLISSGIIELIPQSQIDYIKASHVQSSPKQNHMNRKAQIRNQQQYNNYNKHKSLMVDSHDSWDSSGGGGLDMNVSDYAGGGFKGDDVISIDLNKSGFNRGGGGQNPNEGGLLPREF